MTSATSSAAGSYARLMTRAREEYAMYEEYYGFVEKPFSLTPDPKYLYKTRLPEEEAGLTVPAGGHPRRVRARRRPCRRVGAVAA
jgi:hypothetical protein